MGKFVEQYFTSNGTFTAPAGVTRVLLIGCGGGGGGGGGNTQGAGGGGGALQGSQWVTVVPNTGYTVTIGTGGAGSAGSSFGNNGDDTTFGSLATFTGAGGGARGLTQAPGSNTRGHPGTTVNPSTSIMYSAGMAGWGGIWGSYAPGAGMRNTVGGFAGGSAGASAGSVREGGGGGGAGPKGAGGNGSNANNAGTASAGASAGANTGAGGGGGGGSSSGNSAGGAGGSGYLYVIWVE